MDSIDDTYPPLQNITDEEQIMSLLIGQIDSGQELNNILEFVEGLLKLCNLWECGMMRLTYSPKSGKIHVYRTFRILDRYFFTLN